ncbi:Uncharacterised protein [Chromobacterium violaceum]|uniref:GIY-YIG domain-containing protein n=1 Tax=Chromobacterium violaceum TaxID=536 RepID=A0A447T877_CHRVL|nr:Uncharacterised protein [Chromobacterium violaceum]
MAADLSSDKEYRSSIYAIYDGKTKKIIYVGLTDYERDGVRFIEHVNNDINYPWHGSKQKNPNAYQDSNTENWPYYPRKLYDCKNFTALETAASEQFYWESNGGFEGKLVNKNQPLRKDTFLKYKNDKTFRAKFAKFTENWTPRK